MDNVLEKKFRTAFDIPLWLRITTGCEAINKIIHGGIPVNGITEIIGPSGVGKTQLCLQLALMTQLPQNIGGLNKGAIYICTEDVFPSKRLQQLVNTLPLCLTYVNKIQFMDCIFLQHISDYKNQLEKCLSLHLPRLILTHKIGIIIIDSIAGIFRSENVNVNYVSRSQQFQMLALQLNRIGTNNDIAIVCTNQVTNNIETGKLEPCLGLSWSNLVTTRLQITRYIDTVRLFEIIFAPDLPNVSSTFTITESGLMGVQ